MLLSLYHFEVSYLTSCCPFSSLCWQASVPTFYSHLHLFRFQKVVSNVNPWLHVLLLQDRDSLNFKSIPGPQPTCLVSLPTDKLIEIPIPTWNYILFHYIFLCDDHLLSLYYSNDTWKEIKESLLIAKGIFCFLVICI